MSLDELIDGLPEYAKDLKLNYSSLVRQNTELTPTQLWGTLLVSAIATREPTLTGPVMAAAMDRLSAEQVDAVKTAGALMGMNNIFYRFHHLTSNEKYSTMPARLRMNGIRTHKADLVDFELWCLAASAVNGCGKCIDAHEKVLRQKGITEEIVISAVRVASISHAIGTVLAVERSSLAIERSSVERPAYQT
ncbi:MAG: carboxymuconolactone decarboxylase family protein [Acidobacteriaceae bacterium]